MRIFNTYEQAAEQKTYCIALGSFDGVHVGHQELIKILKNNSLVHNSTSMIYTFTEHPRKVLMQDRPVYMITNNTQRTEIIEKMGIEGLFLEHFEEVMKLSADQFFHEIIVNKFHARALVVGYNYKFGCNSEGDVEKLVQLGDKYDIEVVVVPPVIVNNEVVSSSLIRHRIYEGRVHEIPQYLGRSYSIQGRVIHGKKNGKAMGIRTANIEISKEAVIPCSGVYITETKINARIYKSITNIGVNPTFHGDKLSIETHILDFENDLYDQEIEVYFLKRLRNEVLFSNVNELVSQIKKDIEASLNYNLL